MLPNVTFPFVTKHTLRELCRPLGFAALLLVGVVGLSACSSLKETLRQKTDERNPAPCPVVIILPEASRMVRFDGPQTVENVAWTGEINQVKTFCRYYDADPIEAELEIDFAFGRGPMAQSNQADMKYFVAVTRTNRDLIAKEEFTLPVKFKKNQTIVEVTDKVQKIIIPRSDEQVAGGNFEIVIGFALSKEEVIYNRSGKSLRFPQLK